MSEIRPKLANQPAAAEPSDKGRWPRIDALVAVIVLVYSSTAFAFMLRPQGQTHPDGDPVLQLVWIPVYAAVASLLLFRNHSERQKRPAMWGLTSILAVSAMSTLWSTAPTLTLRRVVALAATAMCGYFLAVRFSTTQVLRLFRATVLICAVSSVVVLVAMPAQALDPLVGDGAVRGVFAARNLLGRMMVLGLAAEVLVFVFDRGRAAVHLVATALFLYLLHLSGSATSLVALLLVCGIILFARSARTGHLGLALGVLLIVAAAGLAFLAFFSGWDVTLRLLDRDPTLTNRTRIWSAVLEAVRARPLLGYGFGAFWRGDAGPSRLVDLRLHAPIAHSHNGFLDIWAQLGLVGLATVLVVLFRSLRGAVSQMSSATSKRGVVAFGLLGFLVLFNINESPLLAQNTIYTVMLFYVITVTGQHPRPARVDDEASVLATSSAFSNTRAN